MSEPPGRSSPHRRGADLPGVKTASLTLLPPLRLGALLSQRRVVSGRSLAEVASGGHLGEDDLAAVERGDLRLSDDQLDAVLDAYRMTADELIPARSQVVVDLDRGQLLVAEELASIDPAAPTADEVLAAYLSLVYTLRHAEPGTPLVLRQFDVAVLSRSLRLAEPDVEARLAGLMRRPSAELSLLHRLLRHKVVVGAVGAAVIAAGVGTVLVLRADDGPTPATTDPATRPSASEVPLEDDATLLPPVVQERTDDTGGVVVEP